MAVERLMTQGLHLTPSTLPSHRSDEEMDEAEGAIVVAKGTSSGRPKKVGCTRSQLSDVLGGGPQIYGIHHESLCCSCTRAMLIFMCAAEVSTVSMLSVLMSRKIIPCDPVSAEKTVVRYVYVKRQGMSRFR